MKDNNERNYKTMYIVVSVDEREVDLYDLYADYLEAEKVMCKLFVEFLNDIDRNEDNLTVQKMYEIAKNENYDEYCDGEIGFRITNSSDLTGGFAWSNAGNRNFDLYVKEVKIPQN